MHCKHHQSQGSPNTNHKTSTSHRNFFLIDYTLCISYFFPIHQNSWCGFARLKWVIMWQVMHMIWLWLYYWVQQFNGFIEQIWPLGATRGMKTLKKSDESISKPSPIERQPFCGTAQVWIVTQSGTVSFQKPQFQQKNPDGIRPCVLNKGSKFYI